MTKGGRRGRLFPSSFEIGHWSFVSSLVGHWWGIRHSPKGPVGPMLSRVAENLYWIGRYVERAENVARLLIDAFQLGLEAGGLADDGPRPLDGVLAILNCGPAFRERAAGPAGESTEALLRFLTLERTGSTSILDVVDRARE